MATNRTLTYLPTDITIHRSIPYVRELTNSVSVYCRWATWDGSQLHVMGQVLLDIPLFMSHHRQKMIEAVCTQANKLYRLWIARNPHFEEYGRVHIIAHSVRLKDIADVETDDEWSAKLFKAWISSGSSYPIQPTYQNATNLAAS